MAQQTIGIGSSANDGTGDTLRVAFDKCNDNFTELYTAAGTFSGALVSKSSDQALSDSTTTILTFDTEQYDEGGWFDSGTSTSRLVVPSGVTRVRLTGGVVRASATGQLVVSMVKNGSGAVGLPTHDTDTAGTDNIAVSSAVLAVTAGDYFELRAFVAGASNITGSHATWFAIEAV